ncbi:hypothetical protein BDK51DRAFT_28916 [Blyttiomyces helicus]|uniref:Uncharacterized protein n=1 Tax=Blyttiomyces helicus TaxID=388810 RepID=A0A4P9W5L5_9FUNG|nr:hypothetical protein BDK51DRAFT_28916 [Blyttiomyces helicus]|eukprot:RKO86623.1 hypothetical protein BDK51DRAFT_28916 [Blyttiomyces helicus]
MKFTILILALASIASGGSGGAISRRMDPGAGGARGGRPSWQLVDPGPNGGKWAGGSPVEPDEAPFYRMAVHSPVLAFSQPQSGGECLGCHLAIVIFEDGAKGTINPERNYGGSLAPPIIPIMRPWASPSSICVLVIEQATFWFSRGLSRDHGEGECLR